MTGKNGPKREALRIQDRFEADIIVVGMDYAGIAAVRAARETGADVIGLDEHSCDDLPLAGRNFEHMNSRFMQEHGIGRIDTEAITAAWPDEDARSETFDSIRIWLTHSGETFDWFTDPLDPEEKARLLVYRYPEEYRPLFPPPPRPEMSAMLTASRFPEPGPAERASLPDCARLNLELAMGQGANLFFQISPLRWIEENGHMCGVIAKRRDGPIYSFSARKGIILSAGLSMKDVLHKSHAFSVPGRSEITRGNFFAGTIRAQESQADVGIGMAITLGRSYGLAAAREYTALFRE